MNKNGESYSCAIEGHRQRARCKRLLSSEKGTVDTLLGSGKISSVAVGFLLPSTCEEFVNSLLLLSS